MNTPQIIQTAKQLARTVGARIRSELESETVLAVSHKGISDIVTEIDLWSEQQIVSAVTSAFPDHLVVGEETSSKLAESRGRSLEQLVSENICWIVDPLDGTSNFSNKVPHCAVSIGIAAKGERVGGVVFDPFRDEMFEAVKGAGAMLNGRKIQVSKKTELVQCLVALGFPNDRWNNNNWETYRETSEALIMSCRNVRACGAAAIEISWTACGRFDGFFEYGIKPWDIAAASIILEEAGGVSRSFGGKTENGYSMFDRSFLFCAESIYPELLEVVTTKKAKPPKR